METLHFFPVPTLIQPQEGSVPRPASLQVTLAPSLQTACAAHSFQPAAFCDALPAGSATDGTALPVHITQQTGNPEGYTLTVAQGGISLQCGGAAGVYYALGTLRQLLAQCPGALPCLTIQDAPALPLRGVLLDVGRDKMPTMNTLYALLDKLADMRYNHVQLYFEGYSFQWPQHQYLFQDETPITPDEMRALAQYAHQRFIELVPNTNTLGHMDKWLALPQFRHLAECEDGYLFENLFHRPPMTLDAQDPGSLPFAMDMVDAVADCCLSTQANVNMDEPFEMGVGKNAGYVAQHGKAPLYMGYLQKVHRHLTDKGRKMVLWGDVVFSHPECIPELPEDVLLLDWMYEGEGDFEPHAKAVAAAGRRFCLCPGTGCWCSFTGRNSSMMKNVANAVDCAVRYGGQGILLTDWGDLGHWQYLSASYPAFAYAAASAWQGKAAGQDAIERYCNQALYQDESGQAFQLAINLGNYYLLEKAPLYSTTLCVGLLTTKYRFSTPEEFDEKLALMLKLSANLAKGMHIPAKPPVVGMDTEEMEAYLEKLSLQIDALQPSGSEGMLIQREMALGLRFVRHGLRLYTAMATRQASAKQFAQNMAWLFTDMQQLLPQHHSLWMARNRSGGYARSSAQFLHLMQTYRNISRAASPAQ